MTDMRPPDWFLLGVGVGWLVLCLAFLVPQLLR